MSVTSFKNTWAFKIRNDSMNWSGQLTTKRPIRSSKSVATCLVRSVLSSCLPIGYCILGKSRTIAFSQRISCVTMFRIFRYLVFVMSVLFTIVQCTVLCELRKRAKHGWFISCAFAPDHIDQYTDSFKQKNAEMANSCNVFNLANPIPGFPATTISSWHSSWSVVCEGLAGLDSLLNHTKDLNFLYTVSDASPDQHSSFKSWELKSQCMVNIINIFLNKSTQSRRYKPQAVKRRHKTTKLIFILTQVSLEFNKAVIQFIIVTRNKSSSRLKYSTTYFE